MCWIAFRKIETLKNMLETQSSRWMDWVGLLYQGERGVTIHKVFVEKNYKNWIEWKTGEKEPMSYYFTDNRTYTFQRLEEFYQDVLELVTRGFDQKKYVFAHHRKWTVWSNNIENTHPFETDKFILAQNGTDKRMHEWGIVEGIDPDRSDTFVLLQYIDMHCNTLEECLARISILLSRKITIGTIMIYSKKEWKMMFFADGERSLYIEKNADGTIDYIQSRKDDTVCDYKTKGYIVTDFSGTVYVENLENVNEAKVTHKPASTPATNYYTQPLIGGQKQYTPARGNYSMLPDDFDDLDWRGIESGFQEIDPDVNDVNEIEAENGWINNMPLSDVMELLVDADEKLFFKLKWKCNAGTATQQEQTEYVNIIIYIGMLIKRWVTLTETMIKALENTKKWFLNLGREPADKDVTERNKKIAELRMQMMELSSYKEIYKL